MTEAWQLWLWSFLCLLIGYLLAQSEARRHWAKALANRDRLEAEAVERMTAKSRAIIDAKMAEMETARQELQRIEIEARAILLETMRDMGRGIK